MEASSFIGIITQVLALGGMVSIRMFLPVFLYFLFMRLAVGFPEYAPGMLTDMAAKVPEWQISLPFLCVFGLLAAAEVAAVRNPDIKQFLVEDIDRYAKPALSILLSCSVVNTAQADGIRQLLGQGTVPVQAGIGGTGVIAAVMACCMTSTFCHLRLLILEKIHAIDPDNSLGLQSVANYAGEITIVVMLVLLVLLPAIALLLTVAGFIFRFLFSKIQQYFEKKRSHLCPECLARQQETRVSNCAVICKECGAEQPDICRVGWFGLTSAAPLDGEPMEKHSTRLLSAHRCRWCAEPLDAGGCNCRVCGRKQWDDEEFVSYYLRQTDTRGLILLGISLLSFLYPVVGCTLVMIFFKPLVLRPLAVHLSRASRFWYSFLTLLFKLLAAVLLILLALVPGIGLIFLLPFFLRYLLVRKKFCRIINS